MKLLKLSFPISIIIMLTSCNSSKVEIEDWEKYKTDHEEWKVIRLDRLKTDNGWLNLAGLLWLNEGKNSFGSDSSNQVVFPEGFPPFAGTITLKNGNAKLIADQGVEILVDGEPVTAMELNTDNQKNTTVMNHGPYRWFIIKRGTQYGIRLRNLEHPRIEQLDHIPAYPFSKEYVVDATLIPYDSVRTVKVPTVIPDFYEYYKVPGELHFKLIGKKHTLLPFGSGDRYFLIVGDETNGIETYGAGRFLSAETVENNKVRIDFNKATNPPCAFSPFATCPLPPPENILDTEIEAGEKAVHLE